VAKPYRKILWVVVFGLLLAVAEYGLAIQSARPDRGSVEVELGEEADHASRESGIDARNSPESLGHVK
jgi:hypothetical protein